MENTTPAPAAPAAPSASEDKTVAILSYITLIGFIVAIVIHSNKKTKLGAFHLRQTLGLIISGIVFGAIAFVLAFIPIIGWLAIMAIWLGFFVLWLLGLIAAATGQLKPVPVLGVSYQKWFASAFE